MWRAPVHDRRFRSRDGRRKNKVAVQEPGVITKIDEEPATAGFDSVGTRIRGGGGELEGSSSTARDAWARDERKPLGKNQTRRREKTEKKEARPRR